MKRRKKVTLAMIARRAGVSNAAVSMALREHPRVSRALSQRVQRIARGMGYRPNPLVAALMVEVRRGRLAESGQRLAFLHGWEASDPRKISPTYSRQFQGVCGRAEELGYAVEVFHVPSGGDEAAAARVIRARGIGGGGAGCAAAR